MTTPEPRRPPPQGEHLQCVVCGVEFPTAYRAAVHGEHTGHDAYRYLDASP